MCVCVSKHNFGAGALLEVKINTDRACVRACVNWLGTFEVSHINITELNLNGMFVYANLCNSINYGVD